MSLDQVITKLPKLEIFHVENASDTILHAKYTGEVRCLHCKSKSLRKKDSFVRKLKSASVGKGYVMLYLNSHKFHCKDCGKYFNQRF